MSIFPTGDKPHPADANPIDNGLADADHPMVSAIISTYNSEQFIRGCLENLSHYEEEDTLESLFAYMVEKIAPPDEQKVFMNGAKPDWFQVPLAPEPGM